MLNKAIEIAAKAHDGQVDKGDNVQAVHYCFFVLVLFKILKYKKYNRIGILGMRRLWGCIMDYMTIKEAGEKWGISGRMVTYHCVAGRIQIGRASCRERV